MPNYRVQVTIPMVSGTPQDAVTNVWHCQADDLTNLDEFCTALTNFYAAIDGSFSNLVSTTGNTIKCYDLSDPEPRAPVHLDSLGSLSVGGNPLPTECALALSFQGQRVSGVSQARRRGRIYLGPIQAGSNHTDGRPTAAFVSGVQIAAQALLDASTADTGWYWAVYSRVNAIMVPVTNGWVDNEWDTQRRRGRAATSRSTFD